jgi:carboxymethylenebutenolidase
MVSFQTNGDKTDGYLAVPAGDGPFPGVIVIQEWWGLNDNIKDIAERFAAEGFVALAPDLYHGKLTAEPDEAMKLMMALDMPRASKELSKAVDYLSARPEVAGRAIGDNPKVKACAPFYGSVPDPVSKLANLQGPVAASYAEHDDFFGPPIRQALEDGMRQYGKQLDLKVYPNTGHAFFNDTRPDAYNAEAAADAWKRTIALFRENL